MSGMLPLLCFLAPDGLYDPERCDYQGPVHLEPVLTFDDIGEGYGRLPESHIEPQGKLAMVKTELDCLLLIAM